MQNGQLLGGGGVGLKSLQTGTIDLNGVTSNTATITSVDTANSLLAFHGFTMAASSLLPSLFPRLDLTNATTITATSNSNNANTRPVGYSVREFHPGGVLKSVQRGTITLNGVSTNNATVTSVDPLKAITTQLGFSYNSGANNDTSLYPRTRLTNATTVTTSSGLAPGFDVIAGYQVEEYY